MFSHKERFFMKFYFNVLAVFFSIVQLCCGCLTIEDTSINDDFSCTLNLNFPSIIKNLMQEQIGDNKEDYYMLTNFIEYDQGQLRAASNFLLREQKLSFNDLDTLKIFLENLKKVIIHYNEKYESFYNEKIKQGMCSIGKCGDISAYIFSINEYISFLEN